MCTKGKLGVALSVRLLKDLESLIKSVHVETKWVKCYSWPFFSLHPNAALVHLALVSAALYLTPPSTVPSLTVPSLLSLFRYLRFMSFKPPCSALVSLFLMFPLPLAHSHHPEARGPPRRFPWSYNSYIPLFQPTRLVPSLISTCHLTRLYTEQSPNHALNLVSFVFNFQPTCFGYNVMYNVRA